MLSHVEVFVTLWTAARQAPLSMGVSWGCWSRLPFPSPGDLPRPGTELASPALAGRFFTSWTTRETPWRMLKSCLFVSSDMWITAQTLVLNSTSRLMEKEMQQAILKLTDIAVEKPIYEAAGLSRFIRWQKGPTSLWRVCCSKDIWAWSLARGKSLAYDRRPLPGHWCVPGTNRTPNLSPGEDTHTGVHTDTSVRAHFDMQICWKETRVAPQEGIRESWIRKESSHIFIWGKETNRKKSSSLKCHNALGKQGNKKSWNLSAQKDCHRPETCQHRRIATGISAISRDCWLPLLPFFKT